MKTEPLPHKTNRWLTQVRARMDATEGLDLPMVFLGIVDARGVVRAEGLRPSIQVATKEHHRVLGLGKRWTYYQNTRWVVWSWEKPTPEDQKQVSEFLRGRGCLVVRHQINQSGF
jgi:hypothetical protein